MLKNYDQDQDPKRSPQISDVSAVSNFCNEVDIGNDDEKKMVQWYVKVEMEAYFLKVKLKSVFLVQFALDFCSSGPALLRWSHPWKDTDGKMGRDGFA